VLAGCWLEEEPRLTYAVTQEGLLHIERPKYQTGAYLARMGMHHLPFRAPRLVRLRSRAARGFLLPVFAFAHQQQLLVSFYSDGYHQEACAE
jgi:hypothetical protein